VASLITVGGAGGPVTGWGDDWAQYIMHARAIAQGRAYSDIGYVWSIYAPLIGPPAYPPGTFVLAPFFLAFGYSMEIASFSMAACFGLFLLAFYAFLSRLGSRQIALATLGGVVNYYKGARKTSRRLGVDRKTSLSRLEIV
jgi:hypothetical protein